METKECHQYVMRYILDVEVHVDDFVYLFIFLLF